MRKAPETNGDTSLQYSTRQMIIAISLQYRRLLLL